MSLRESQIQYVDELTLQEVKAALINLDTHLQKLEYWGRFMEVRLAFTGNTKRLNLVLWKDDLGGLCKTLSPKYMPHFSFNPEVEGVMILFVYHTEMMWDEMVKNCVPVVHHNVTTKPIIDPSHFPPIRFESYIRHPTWCAWIQDKRGRP
jgi:hypothetical protein